MLKLFSYLVEIKNGDNMKSFSKELIIERLWADNSWWQSSKIEPYFQRMKPRLYFQLFYPLAFDMSLRRAVILTGPRRVGKTVMLFQTIQALINDGISPRKICYISVETPIYNNIDLEELFLLAREASGELETDGWYVVFDEIQYFKDWELHLKVMVDRYKTTKFIVSGSAAAALQRASIESGAGRFTDFMLPPLTFIEYVQLQDLGRLIQPTEMEWGGSSIEFVKTTNIDELNGHFLDYLNYGGYPEALFSSIVRADPRRHILTDIIDKVLLKDLPSLYGIRDVRELYSLFTTLAYHSGNENSYESISQKSGIDKVSIKKYLDYLEASFLIKIVHRIDDNAKKFQRASLFKVYLTNPALRSALFTFLKIDDDFMGPMVETAIFSQWMHRDKIVPYYARWQSGEVDMVKLDEKTFKPSWALEIKWSNDYFDNPGKLKNLFTFCEKNDLTEALVTTKTKTGQKNAPNSVRLQFVPAALYAYNIGKNTLGNKMTSM